MFHCSCLKVCDAYNTVTNLGIILWIYTRPRCPCVKDVMGKENVRACSTVPRLSAPWQKSSGPRMSSCPAAGGGRKRRAAAADDTTAEQLPPTCRTRTSPPEKPAADPVAATATSSTSEDTAGENSGTPTPQHAPGLRRSLIFTLSPPTSTTRLPRPQGLVPTRTKDRCSPQAPRRRT